MQCDLISNNTDASQLHIIRFPFVGVISLFSLVVFETHKCKAFRMFSKNKSGAFRLAGLAGPALNLLLSGYF